MNHTRTLREVAKFVAGLVAGDLVAGLWFLAAGAPSQSFLGIPVSAQQAWLWVCFDLFILFALIHYAWTPKLLEPRGASKPLFFVVGIITGAVAIVHLFRLVFGWQVVVDSWILPLWPSGVAIIVAGYISYASFHFAAKHGKV